MTYRKAMEIPDRLNRGKGIPVPTAPFSIECKGYLIDSVQYKDKYVGGKAGRFYKRYLDYTYRYKVNGKDYTVSGGVPGTNANMNSVVDVIYQKNNPKYAYIHKLTIPMQPIIVALLCPLWIAACILGISLL